jgi:hypothetical protein
MCLIGHGAFGIITKSVWCNYLAIVGLSPDQAYHLMPIIGTLDIAMGLSLLLYPTRAILGWLVFWGFATAAMRPLSGEPFAELLEGAGNFGAPLALLMLCPSAKFFRGWFIKLQASEEVSQENLEKVLIILRLIASSFFIGHGLLNLLGKKGLIDQYQTLGFNNPIIVSYIVGTIEVAAGGLFLIVRPLAPFILFFLIGKMGTELFYPQWEIFEWIERGGSYGVLLALLFASLREGHK